VCKAHGAGFAVCLIVLIDDKVKHLVYQTQGIDLSRRNIGVDIRNISPLLIHPVAKLREA